MRRYEEEEIQLIVLLYSSYELFRSSFDFLINTFSQKASFPPHNTLKYDLMELAGQ